MELVRRILMTYIQEKGLKTTMLGLESERQRLMYSKGSFFSIRLVKYTTHKLS